MLYSTVNDKHRFQLSQLDGKWMIGDEAVAVDFSEGEGGIISVLHRGKSFEGIIESIDKAAKTVQLRLNGQRYTVAIEEPIDQLLREMGLDMSAAKKAEPVKAPMPGMVLKVLVTPGQRISKGDGLLILEAMKMENVLKASGDATVKSIRIQERTAVGKGDILIELE